MQFLKAFSIFILLLTGNTGFAFSFPDEEKQTGTQEISFELSQDHPESFESTITQFDVTSLRLFSPQAANFYFQSLRKAVEADAYISYSRFIAPALGVSQIVFPFHTFL